MLCWGNTVNGELGLGGIEDERLFQPHELKFDQVWEVKDVVCGENHTLMVLLDGQIWSCGSNDYGQLGHNKARKRPEPVDNLHHQKIVKAAAGFAHSLALDQWGQIFSWGWDASGQLGHNIEQNSVTMPRLLKSLASKQVIQIACGLHHSMALTNSGEIYSWGSNVHGQLGLGCRDMVVHSPMLVKSLVGMPISYIVCGGYHSFAVSKSGAVFGWGKNTFGQIGLGDCQDRTRPYLLSSLENQKIVYMCCGRDHSVALTKMVAAYQTRQEKSKTAPPLQIIGLQVP